MATIAEYNGTTKLGDEYAKHGLCSANSSAKISNFTAQAALALGLPTDTKGRKPRPPADNVAILKWILENVSKKPSPPTTVSIERPQADIAVVDSDNAPVTELPVASDEANVDLVGIDTATESTSLATTATPSNTGSTIEPLSNEVAVFERQGGIVSTAIDSLVDQIVKNADDGIAATIEQIKNVIKLQKSAQNIDRAAIYWHRQKRTFSQLGYESFEAFGLAEFGYEKAYLHQTANAYVIEKSLGKSAIADSKQIPEGQLRPLSPVPENERAAIWEEANRKAKELGKERTAKMVQEAVSEWKSKNESLQNDLDDLSTKIIKVQQAADELRANQSAIIDAINVEQVPIEPPPELKTVEVRAVDVDNAVIEEVRHCLETIESHLKSAQFSDKWRVELAEYKRIGAIFESLVSSSTIIDGVVAE